MKKLIFLFAFLITLSNVFPQAEAQKTGNTVTSQLSKGNFFLGGASRLELNAGKYNIEYQDSTLYDKRSSTSIAFNFQPRAGYYIINNLVTGIFIDMYLATSITKVDTFKLKGNHTKFIIGPFARYYFPVSDKLIPFIEGQVGFGVDNYKSQYNDESGWSKSKVSTFTLRTGAGATYFFNETIGADLFLGYEYDSNTENGSSGGYINNDRNTFQNIFVTQLGLVVIL